MNIMGYKMESLINRWENEMEKEKRRKQEEVLEEFFNKLDSFGYNDNEKEVIFKNLTFVLQFGSSHFQKFVIDTIRAYENEIGKQLLVSQE